MADLSTRIAGPYCSKLFADAGAEVWKVETEGGDPLRAYTSTGPPADNEDGALFRFLNAGKRIVIAPDGGRGLDELIAACHLVIEDGTGPAVDLSSARAQHPGLVVVSISPYGRSGPLAHTPATELTVQAESGALMFKGRPDRPPVQAGGDISQFLTGVHSAPAALAAVMKAVDTGEGELIDIAAIDVMAVSGTNFASMLQELWGSPPVARPTRFVDTPGIERAADGYIAFNANTGLMFENFLLMIGRPELIGYEGLSNLRNRLSRLSEWQTMVDHFVSHRSTRELMDLAVELRIPVAPVHDGATVLDDEHLAARGVFAKGFGGLTGPLAPYRVDGTRRPVPQDVERPRLLDPAAVPPAVGRSGQTSARPSGHRPLAGLRILDLTSWWVGAAASHALALLGADVIHIESTSHPDGMRFTGAFLSDRDWWEWGYMFLGANTNKRGLTLDLAQSEGRRILLRLLEQADVLVENFSPRVAERFGLDEESVLGVNPNLVYVRMPAYGLIGPWRDRPAFAQTIEPMATMAHVTGYPDDPPLSKGGLADAVGGAHGAWAVLVGLAQRRATDRGVVMEAPMIEAALNVAALAVLEHDAYGTDVGRRGNRASGRAPQGVYACVGHDEWIAVSVTNDAEWDGLRRAMGDPSWARAEQYRTARGREADHDTLDRQLEDWTNQRPLDEAVATLRRHGVPVGACWEPRLISAHPQLVHRRLFTAVDHPVVGTHHVPGAPYRFESVDTWVTKPAPTLGQHSTEVLHELLGLGEVELDRLETLGVVGTRPRGF